MTTLATMRHLAALALALALAGSLAACGGSDAAPATTPATVAASTSTTSTTIATTTTTEVPLSREARLAVERCLDGLGPLFSAAVAVEAIGGDVGRLTETQTACDEADLQIQADNPTAGSAASRLSLAVSEVNVTLAYAKVRILSDTYDTAAQTQIQDEVDAFEKTVGPLL